MAFLLQRAQYQRVHNGCSSNGTNRPPGESEIVCPDASGGAGLSFLLQPLVAAVLGLLGVLGRIGGLRAWLLVKADEDLRCYSPTVICI